MSDALACPVDDCNTTHHDRDRLRKHIQGKAQHGDDAHQRAADLEAWTTTGAGDLAATRDDPHNRQWAKVTDDAGDTSGDDDSDADDSDDSVSTGWVLVGAGLALVVLVVVYVHLTEPADEPVTAEFERADERIDDTEPDDPEAVDSIHDVPVLPEGDDS